MAQHWDRDPQSGDYLLAGGKPVQTDSLRIPAYLRLKIRRFGTLDNRRQGWMYAPTNKYGSSFYQIQKNRSASDQSFLEDVAAAALTPLVEDGRASEIENTVEAGQRHGVQLKTKITESATRETEIVIVPLGG